MTAVHCVTPTTPEDASEVMRAAAATATNVRPRGAGTKFGWGRPIDEPNLEISTARLDRIIEHNEGDLTAVLEAGVPLQRAQEAFARAGQMLTLDPPLGDNDAATIGGIVATADQGPLRHRYGACRDLLLGVTVVLPDGTLARSGGKVIKNVAGYDLAKLYAGSFGTLGLIVEVIVRLQPQPVKQLTLMCETDDAESFPRAPLLLSHAALEMDCLDVGWRDGTGTLMALFRGAFPEGRAQAAARLLEPTGMTVTTTEGVAPWAEQRARQRASEGAVVRVSGRATDLFTVIECAQRTGATLVGRAGLGISWLSLPASEPNTLISAIEEMRSELSPRACVLLDAPEEVRAGVDVWGREHDEGALALMRRVKSRFDPAGLCSPGRFLGGI
ncbi:MAG: FAD-binding oxidoreductase [Actinobacteria bacterium]|nr:FAD-binding oxidoreductase [Actinomycetota bacterium]